ncbi:MAG: hypothetical protein P4L26_11180 [Terracidiphilus sp.]|jgi:hypothetical protein|nr:hypothetical protein [Terracidiphilus sp.]
MQYHLTSSQLLTVGFALILGIVCALGAVLLSRTKRTPSFRGYFCSDFDRSPFADDALNESEDVLDDGHTTFSDFSARYRKSSGWRARAQNVRE